MEEYVSKELESTESEKMKSERDATSQACSNAQDFPWYMIKPIHPLTLSMGILPVLTKGWPVVARL